MAAAAKIFAIPAVIVMPKDAPRAKIEGTKAYGAEVLFYDRVTDDREAIAAAVCDARHATLVRPFDDAGVVAGQGTVGLEIARQAPVRLDAVLVPCSGGGVASGIALAISGASPGTEVISVEPEDFDGMRRSLLAGERSTAPGGALSIADALMAPTPGKVPFAPRETVDRARPDGLHRRGPRPGGGLCRRHAEINHRTRRSRWAGGLVGGPLRRTRKDRRGGPDGGELRSRNGRGVHRARLKVS